MANQSKISCLGFGLPVAMVRAGISEHPRFLRSMVMLGLGQFGLLPQDCLGEFFEAPEQDLQLSILDGGVSIQGRRFRRELHIDGFTVGLIGDFEVGSVALGGV